MADEEEGSLLRPDSSSEPEDLEAGRRGKGSGELSMRIERSRAGRRRSGGDEVDDDREIVAGDEDRGFSPLTPRRRHRHLLSLSSASQEDALGDVAPPEWALLLVGCLLGLASGVCVAAFNRGVHIIHEWAWAGTPNEGATWLRLQRLEDTWHRVLIIPVSGGIIVGMLHGLLEIIGQIKKVSSTERPSCDLFAGIFPTIKAIQAAITLGTGCSLGPEGPSVDIGKSCANGCLKMIENNRERRIAFIAAGAAAGIASGFNAAVAGCFFAIETVLRPLQAENSPPFTTAMIILASVISSTVSNVLLGERPVFTVPTYELKSAAELPLYLILGMFCGIVSVIFTCLVGWFTKAFHHIENRFHLPAVVYPALGGLGAGIISLRYPGILYWGFTNVDEILHTGKSASAPGIWLLTQLAGAKVVATALCKGSRLVGGLYAPSLMIGAAVGAVFGGSAAEILNYVIPGNVAVAQPQAYALVGMAATLASVCSVPLTSVLLIFELTKDYRIILPLMGAVGLAIWVPSVANHSKGIKAQNQKHAFSSIEEINDCIWRKDRHHVQLSVLENDNEHNHVNDDAILDVLKVSEVMSRDFAKVTSMLDLKDAIWLMHDGQHKCVLVVDFEDLLEGILTSGDISRRESKISANACDTSLDDSAVIDVCTRKINYRGEERGLLTCFPDTDLTTAKELMEAKGVKQLPVVKRGDLKKERKRQVLGIIHYNSIEKHLREELDRRNELSQQRKQEAEDITVNDH